MINLKRKKFLISSSNFNIIKQKSYNCVKKKKKKLKK